MAQRTLRGLRERAGRRRHHFVRLLVAHLRDEAGQPLLQVAEDTVDLGAGRAGFVLVHQGVVGREAGLVGQALRHLATKPQHLAKIFEKAGPVVRRPLRAPGVLAARACKRRGLDQRLRQCIGRSPIAPDLAEVGVRMRVEGLGGSTLQQIDELRVGAHAVQQTFHLGHRVGTRIVALGRHHRGLVPAGQRLQVVKVVQPGPDGGQLVVGGVHAVSFGHAGAQRSVIAPTARARTRASRSSS